MVTGGARTPLLDRLMNENVIYKHFVKRRKVEKKEKKKKEKDYTLQLSNQAGNANSFVAMDYYLGKCTRSHKLVVTGLGRHDQEYDIASLMPQ